MKKKAKITVKQLLDKELEAYEKFHKRTMFKSISNLLLDPKKWPESWKVVYYKAYSRFPEYILPPPSINLGSSLQEALVRRQSKRRFSDIPLTHKQLSNLLYYSAGIKNIRFPNQIGRFYPSGGARYPMELYVLSLNSAIPKGIYHYYLKNHSLERLQLVDKFPLLQYFGQKWVSQASCVLLLTAVFKRTTIKYGDRGYRHILVEAGHLGQNIYLLSSALNINCCALGGYVDYKLNDLLNIDTSEEVVIYALAIGNKPKLNI